MAKAPYYCIDCNRHTFRHTCPCCGAVLLHKWVRRGLVIVTILIVLAFIMVVW